jgi:hypothetical protein
VKCEKEPCVPTKNDILLQASKALPTISPFYGVNPSFSTVLKTVSEKKQMGK